MGTERKYGTKSISIEDISTYSEIVYYILLESILFYFILLITGTHKNLKGDIEYYKYLNIIVKAGLLK